MNQEEMRKDIVKRAKLRMTSGDYDAIAADVKIEDDEGESLDNEKLKHYAAVVKEIKESPIFVYDPLRRMMDEEHYASLPENDRMGYLLEIAKIYKEMSAKYKKS